MSRSARVLYVRVEGFYVRELARRGEAGPVVVHNEGRVLDAAEEVALRGVHPGMPVGQARALLREARHLPLAPDDYREASRRWLDALVPFSDRIEPLSLHEAAVDLSGHPRAEEIGRRAVAKVAEREPRLAVGWGAGVWLARLAADRRRAGAFADPAGFLSPLPVSDLPISPRATARLAGLGCATIADAARLSRATLRSQFRDEGELIHLAARGLLCERPRALYPEDALSRSVLFEGGEDSLENIFVAVGELAGEIGGRLAEAERETPDLSLHIEYEAGGETRSRTFARAIDGPRALYAALRLLIGDGFGEPVYAIRAVLPDLRRPRRRQSSLFAPPAADRLVVERAVQSVRDAFGADRIRLASQLKVERRKVVLREMGGLVGWR